MSDRTTDYRSIWTELMGVAFTHGWIDVDGVSTRYMQAGPTDGPALLLMHGTGGSLETFCRNFKVLSKTHNCIAYDMVGTGFSDKPDYPYEIPVYAKQAIGLLDVLGVERASLIGVSLGAWVAVRFAHDFPERTDKIVLISAAGLINSASNMAEIRERRLAVVDNPTWDSVEAIFHRLIDDEADAIPDLTANRQAFYRLPEMRRAMENILVLQDEQVRNRNNLSREEWAAIAAPTLIILAVDHPDVYLDTGRELPSIMQSASTAEMPGTGHWPHFEDPETFNVLAADFLAV